MKKDVLFKTATLIIIINVAVILAIGFILFYHRDTTKPIVSSIGLLLLSYIILSFNLKKIQIFDNCLSVYLISIPFIKWSYKLSAIESIILKKQTTAYGGSNIIINTKGNKYNKFFVPIFIDREVIYNQIIETAKSNGIKTEII